eukprot:m.418497 g.418497  ORF g.418497 m.418497 type:complete len:246 (+) comp16834_c1_seq2:673-1410(+)
MESTLKKYSARVDLVSVAKYTRRKDLSQDKVLPVIVENCDSMNMDFRFLLTDTTTKACNEVLDILREHNVAVMLGVSGCGKTSSAFALARFITYCIFLEAPTNGIKGSQDFRRLMWSKLSSNDEFKRRMLAMLGVRCLLLKKFLESEDASPDFWLILQLPDKGPRAGGKNSFLDACGDISAELLALAEASPQVTFENLVLKWTRECQTEVSRIQHFGLFLHLLGRISRSDEHHPYRFCREERRGQ